MLKSKISKENVWNNWNKAAESILIFILIIIFLIKFYFSISPSIFYLYISLLMVTHSMAICMKVMYQLERHLLQLHLAPHAHRQLRSVRVFKAEIDRVFTWKSAGLFFLPASPTLDSAKVGLLSTSLRVFQNVPLWICWQAHVIN